MLYAIIDENNFVFKGFYNDEITTLDVNEYFIEIDAAKRDDLIANPKQQWTGSEWEAIPATLDELKNAKVDVLNSLYQAAQIFNYEHGSETGSGWLTRQERIELIHSTIYSGGNVFYILNIPLTIDVSNPVQDAIEQIEAYQYALDNWKRNKYAAISAAADTNSLDAIDLESGMPNIITIEFPI